MKHRVLTAVLVVSVVAGVFIGPRAVAPVVAQPQRVCLHDPYIETPQELSRRQQALGVARAINTAQAAYWSRTRADYGRLEQIGVTAPLPDGFVAALTSDGHSYAFSVKDTLDPCRFGYFSDQDGVIYHGQVIQ